MYVPVSFDLMNNRSLCDLLFIGMQMPSNVQVSSTGFRGSMDRSITDQNKTSLHNKLADFVLDLQTDVRLEDLLDTNDNNVRASNVNEQTAPATQQHIPAERKELHVKHLRHLYNEIKSQQSGTTNAREQQGKRRLMENNSPGFARNKTMRNSEFLLHDTDGLDETWLLNFASQLGLDKKMDLPELNCDFMQGFL